MEDNNKDVYFGSDVKLKITLDFGEVSPDSIDFDVIFKCGIKGLTLNKSQLVRVDEHTYLACVKSPDTSRGNIQIFVRAKFADNDFADGIHTVVQPSTVDARVI